jgi:hypothetical protein
MRTLLVVILLGLGRTASASPADGLRAPALESRHATFGVTREVALTPSGARRAADTGEVPMPWIWQVLRDKVVSQLPRYEQRSFTMRLSPVAVTMVDTVPGVGVEGRF